MSGDFLEGFEPLADGYQRLWTPHRLVYLRHGQQPPADQCPFCMAPEKIDSDGLIVRRGKTCYVLMNLFPYNTGHMMVVPYRHIATYDLATDAEVAEMAALTQQAMRTLQEVLKVHGMNIGMNQGEVAGAGIAEHLHQHIVPRWRNDANFFPIIAKTKSLPILLEEIRTSLAEGWVSEA
jgi:ATP adenylyltransferase